MKTEVIKSLISGLVNGIVVAIFLIWGVRSSLLDVEIEKQLLIKEHSALQKQQIDTLEQNIEFRRRYDDLQKNYSVLQKNYEALQESLKDENSDNGIARIRKNDNL